MLRNAIWPGVGCAVDSAPDAGAPVLPLAAGALVEDAAALCDAFEEAPGGESAAIRGVEAVVGCAAAPADGVAALVDGVPVLASVAAVAGALALDVVAGATALAAALVADEPADAALGVWDAAAGAAADLELADGAGRIGVSTVQTPGGSTSGADGWTAGAVRAGRVAELVVPANSGDADDAGGATAGAAEAGEVTAAAATAAAPDWPSRASAPAGHHMPSAPATTTPPRNSRITRFIAPPKASST